MKFFLARRSVFDRQRNLAGYELLFRSGETNAFGGIDGDLATSRVITDASMSMRISDLVGDTRAFINFTRALLVQGMATLLPPEAVVVEVLENVEPDDEVVEACRRLKARGYLLALDDFTWSPHSAGLLALADIVKIDFRASDPREQAERVRACCPGAVQLLAEKVETYAEFERGLGLGYDLFQGYFFARPEMLSGKAIRGHKATYLDLVREINRPDSEMKSVEAILKRDVGLSYKLLRYVDSPFFGWRSEIRSVRHALVLMGRSEFRKWATVVALAGVGDDKPMELLVLAVSRAHFLGALAERTGLRGKAEDLFLLGLFSLLDAMIDHPLDEALAHIPLSPEVRTGLLERRGWAGELLELCRAAEQADARSLDLLTARLSLPADLPDLYMDALAATNRLFATVGGEPARQAG